MRNEYGELITFARLAVLKAASEFCASRSELKSADVLQVAELWERWVNRKGEEP